ncbi:hypothetical protein B0A55_00019 [Friedmanniomyces simplex]|uniref:DUF3752 domain-containing protein n=1 Tax=Friedmanniomyces simplex TaxID=329884 RepID=A0A4U0Y2W6_9PEZI|nr:hypothetical protein B0A55_00019 [Friedmanniomyces simplex]
MSAIGPDLPPHLLAKRKRQQDDSAQDEPSTASGAKRSTSPGDGEKRRKVIGPAMPPAPLDEQPPEPAAQAVQPNSDDEDDDFGPALPSTIAASTNPADNDAAADTTSTLPNAAPEKLRRDEWMTMPPKQDDLAARMDPTKQRARGFNTGKGAKGPNAVDDSSSAWNETPEQRQKRLRDEMMGVSKPETPGPAKVARSAKNEVVDEKAKEQTEKSRGPSLMDKHKQTTGPEAEDDPSKRAFDREKDMITGMRIGHAQRKDLLNKAAGFSSKFSGGSYL